MAEGRDDDLLLVALLALLREGVGDDPRLYEYLFRRRADLNRDPELRFLLERSLQLPRRSRRAEDVYAAVSSAAEPVRRSLRDHSKRLSAISKRLASLEQSTEDRLTTLGALTTDTRATLHDVIWSATTGADLAAAELHRFVPVRVFFDDSISDDGRGTVIDAIEGLLRPLGFEKSYELPDEDGSWWKKFVLRTSQALTHDEVRRRLEKAERAVEATYLDKPQAEANHLQAEAAASLIQALNTTGNACIQVGSLLLVKATRGDGQTAIIARTLTFDELKRLEEHQSMLRQPEAILDWLEDGKTRLVS